MPVEVLGGGTCTSRRRRHTIGFFVLRVKVKRFLRDKGSKEHATLWIMK